MNKAKGFKTFRDEQLSLVFSICIPSSKLDRLKFPSPSDAVIIVALAFDPSEATI